MSGRRLSPALPFTEGNVKHRTVPGSGTHTVEMVAGWTDGWTDDGRMDAYLTKQTNEVLDE